MRDEPTLNDILEELEELSRPIDWGEFHRLPPHAMKPDPDDPIIRAAEEEERKRRRLSMIPSWFGPGGPDDGDVLL